MKNNICSGEMNVASVPAVWTTEAPKHLPVGFCMYYMWGNKATVSGEIVIADSGHPKLNGRPLVKEASESDVLYVIFAEYPGWHAAIPEKGDIEMQEAVPDVGLTEAALARLARRTRHPEKRMKREDDANDDPEGSYGDPEADDDGCDRSRASTRLKRTPFQWGKCRDSNGKTLAEYDPDALGDDESARYYDEDPY